jgi:hypothetical protein
VRAGEGSASAAAGSGGRPVEAEARPGARSGGGLADTEASAAAKPAGPGASTADLGARSPSPRVNLPGTQAAAAPPAATRARPGAGLPPSLDEMPADFRATLPRLRIDVLVYSESGADPLVFINGRKYAPGQDVEGLALESIRAEGVVLVHRGQRFLLKAQQ